MAGPIKVAAHLSGGHFVRASTRRTLIGAGFNRGGARGYTSKYIAATKGGSPLRQRIVRFGGDMTSVRAFGSVGRAPFRVDAPVRVYASPTKSSLARLSRLHWMHASAGSPAEAAGRAAQIARTKRIYGRFGG